MPRPLPDADPHPGVLCIAAAPAEARAIAQGLDAPEPGWDWRPVDAHHNWRLVRSGVGKVNAAGCIIACLAKDIDQTPMVINLGVCGSLGSGPAAPPIGSVIVASSSLYADEGISTPGGYEDMAAAGFPPWPGALARGESGRGCSGVVAEHGLVQATREKLEAALSVKVLIGPIATVSTCSGTDALAREVAARTGAIAEAMEGAAVAHALMRLRGSARDFLEVRVVSNTTGDRDKQVWDLPGALVTLSRVARALRSQ
jgi:futalosine hydrolase